MPFMAGFGFQHCIHKIALLFPRINIFSLSVIVLHFILQFLMLYKLCRRTQNFSWYSQTQRQFLWFGFDSLHRIILWDCKQSHYSKVLLLFGFLPRCCARTFLYQKKKKSEFLFLFFFVELIVSSSDFLFVCLGGGILPSEKKFTVEFENVIILSPQTLNVAYVSPYLSSFSHLSSVL